MVEVAKERAEFKNAVIYASPQYKEIMMNQTLYQQLYKLVVLEDVSDIYQLADRLGLRYIGDAARLRRVLEGYIKVVFEGKYDRRAAANLICPQCFKPSLVDTAKIGGDEIKMTCSDEECGFELDDSFADFEVFSKDLDRDVTFAPTSAISYTGGKGCTFSPNSDREHKHFLYSIVNSDNVLFSDFEKSHPEIASQFKAAPGEADCFEVVWAGELGKVYCRTGSFVRMVSIDDYFNAVNGLFHQFDGPLRKQKLELMLDPKNELRRAKEYGLKLCERFGFNNKDRDQAIYNTVGTEIDRLKAIVDMRKRHVSMATFTETVFYLVVLRFDRKGLASRVKSELSIDLCLVNFINDVLFALEKDGVSPDGSSVFLEALERSNAARVAAASNSMKSPLS